jgi:membrane protein
MTSHRSTFAWLAYAAIIAVAVFDRGKQHPDQRRNAAAAHRAFGVPSSEDEPLEVQYQRSAEPGRGREATRPWQIPWRGWNDILWRTYQGVNDNRLLAVAAGVAFYSLLALFPATAAFVSLYGLFADSTAVNNQLSMASGILPGGALDIIRDQVNRVVANNSAKLGFGFIVGLMAALWSANAGMKAMIDALNVVYDEKEKRNIVKLNLMSLAFTLAGIASLVLALAAVVAAPLVLNYIGLSRLTDSVFRLARWPILLGLSIAGLALIYRYAPSRREPRWQWISVGSIFAAALWLLASVLFSWYVSSFGNFNATYGSLGAAIGMMTWMWISAVIILLGAQINAEIEHQTAKDSTVGGDKPLGARGAVMADTVGAAQS